MAMQANMKEDVQQSAAETAGDQSADASPEPARPGGEGIADLGTAAAGEKDVTPNHHRLAKSVNGSPAPAGEGGRRRSF